MAGELTASDETEREGLLAFVHVPRSGGGTATNAISRNYARAKGPGNVQKSPEKAAETLQRIAAGGVAGVRAVADHVPYGLYRSYLAGDTRYITFLREPVDRVLSHYHFHARKSTRKLQTIWEDLAGHDRAERARRGDTSAGISLDGIAEYSLEEGLARGIPIYNNLATRFLCGAESLFGDLPDDAGAQAQANLEQFAFVGITERFDESLILLGRLLGIGLMPYQLRHVAEGRPTTEETPAELRALIAEHNAADLELYRFARARFDALAADAGDLATDVAGLRRLSAEVTAAAQAEQQPETTTPRRARRKRREAEPEAEPVAQPTPRQARAAKPAKTRRERRERPSLERVEQQVDALEKRLTAVESMLAGAASHSRPG